MWLGTAHAVVLVGTIADDRFIACQRSTVNVDPAKAERCTSTRSAAPASPTGSARFDTGRGVHDMTSQDSS
ncbi:hypothetical protein RB628_01055 [Streptomyces sp. ADMS]|uniref:hypothetical protein n=1 Tax=Streptomyces sp. ADMS TaxID=3071415 RepID=UPI00296F595A|nr:hypothetical protein [Streptomyces sp. ADMS]MDW4903966.1 hypothetical protein [Streptomyces sp. ADMS]